MDPLQWITLALMEVRNMDEADLTPPIQEVMDGDIEFGTIDAELQMLYSLCQRYLRLSMEENLRAKFAKSKDEELERSTNAKKWNSKYDSLINLFWVSVIEHCNLWDQIGQFQFDLRENWTLVGIVPVTTSIFLNFNDPDEDDE